MPVSIQSRLLLLVLAWAVPALAALLAMIHFIAQGERQANERALRDLSRAMSMTVQREIDRRAFVARAVAGLGAPAALRQPDARGADVARAQFENQVRAAMQGLEGWVEVRDEDGVAFDSRTGGPATVAATAPTRLTRTPSVSPLELGAGRVAHAVVTHPVTIDGGTLVANVAVAILPSELQRLIDALRLPQGWVGVVLDTQRRVVARQPGGASMLGRETTLDVRQQLARGGEGAFEATSLDGAAVSGWFTTSPHGWTYVAAMPRLQFGGYFDGATPRIIGGALVLLALALAGALWVSRSIAGAVVSLESMARELATGQPVAHRGTTGIRECDGVAAALAAASRTTRGARAELEQQVAQAVARTRDAEQQAERTRRVAAIGRLTGGVAHDVNNLLAVVSNSAHLVQGHADANPQLKSPVASILRAVDAGSRLTQQLMRFAARRPVAPKAFDVARALPELEDLLRNVVGRRIEVHAHAQPGTDAIVVDTAELELALVNLALNARDAMPAGGTLRLTVRNADDDETATLAPGRYVAIDVADDGRGFDAATAERVFEPFVSTKPFGEGTGLGLAQVHGFCRQAGGEVHLDSAPGRGTRITLLLPAAASAPAPGTQAPRAGVAPDALASMRIAVVEDNDALGDTTAALLRSHGAEVVRLHDATAALEAVDANERDGQRFDVVLSDVMMPGPIDGVDLARALTRRTPRVPVVLVSGYLRELDPDDGFEVLPKPVSVEALVQALLEAAGKASSS